MSIHTEQLKSEIRQAIINQKANACPMAVRLAWHAAGTFDKSNGSGGTDGATMRFEPEMTDDANAGLGIIRDMLAPIKRRHPEVSYADLWVAAGCAAIEFAGGPSIPMAFGRSDAANGSACPANGRLPDAHLGAEHLREVFYRMGLDDRDIVALSGAHTLGRCHKTRSGFDGPWTHHPLKFDNMYFKNLMNLEWKRREWDGEEQYQDPSGELMMLATDLALKTDPKFAAIAASYAKDEALFFTDFAKSYSKLLHNGCASPAAAPKSEAALESEHFREHAMHGSLERMQIHAAKADVHSVEASAGRSALHKAAYWGHTHVIEYLLSTCKLNPNVQDSNGDTALHDAARFGHAGVVALLAPVTDASLKNADGLDCLGVATQMGKDDVAATLRSLSPRVALSTHVLNTTAGKPARGVGVTVEQLVGSEWKVLARRETDVDGRVGNLLTGSIAAGTYRLCFATKEYFAPEECFYPYCHIAFEIRDTTQKYHVPLLLSPFGYSTYRGS